VFEAEMQMRGFTTTTIRQHRHREHRAQRAAILSVKPLNEALRILQDFTRRDIFQLKAHQLGKFSRPLKFFSQTKKPSRLNAMA